MRLLLALLFLKPSNVSLSKSLSALAVPIPRSLNQVERLLCEALRTQVGSELAKVIHHCFFFLCCTPTHMHMHELVRTAQFFVQLSGFPFSEHMHEHACVHGNPCMCVVFNADADAVKLT